MDGRAARTSHHQQGPPWQQRRVLKLSVTEVHDNVWVEGPRHTSTHAYIHPPVCTCIHKPSERAQTEAKGKRGSGSRVGVGVGACAAVDAAPAPRLSEKMNSPKGVWVST